MICWMICWMIFWLYFGMTPANFTWKGLGGASFGLFAFLLFGHVVEAGRPSFGFSTANVTTHPITRISDVPHRHSVVRLLLYRKKDIQKTAEEHSFITH